MGAGKIAVAESLKKIFTAREFKQYIRETPDVVDELQKSWDSKVCLGKSNIAGVEKLLESLFQKSGPFVISGSGADSDIDALQRHLESNAVSFLDYWNYMIEMCDSVNSKCIATVNFILQALMRHRLTIPLSFQIGTTILELLSDHDMDYVSAYFRILFANSLSQLQVSRYAQYRERALELCEQVEGYFNKEESPLTWAYLNSSIGIVFIDRTRGIRADNLEMAIQYLTNSLEIYTHQDFSLERSNVFNHLGIAYWARIKGDRADNLEKALFYYKQTLKVWTKEYDSGLWARVKANLGVAYANRIKGNRAENIEIAIQHSTDSLSKRSPVEDPMGWAMCKCNLGEIHRVRIMGDQAENIEIAINHYHEALEVCLEDSYPLIWASIQSCLASAYWSRKLGIKENNIYNAFTHYDLALKIYTKSDYPEKWAGLQNNIGVAWRNLMTGNLSENLKKARYHLELANEIRTKENFPREWADTQHNLGFVYESLVAGAGDRLQNFNKAYQYFSNTLAVRTFQNLPIEWAHTQISIGLLFYKNIDFLESHRFQEALDHLSNSLKIYKSHAFPEKNLAGNLAIGNIHLKLNKIDEAILAFEDGINAFENMYRQSITNESVRYLLHNNAPVFFLAAYCYALQSNLTRSVQLMNLGKARVLAERITLDRVVLDEIKDEDREKYKALIEKIRCLEGELNNPVPGARDHIEITTDMKDVRQSLDCHIKNIQIYKPDFLQWNVSLDSIQSILPDDSSVIVEFCITDYGTAVNVLTYPSNGSDSQGWIDISKSFNTEELENLFIQWQNLYNSFKPHHMDQKARTEWEQKSQDLIQEFYNNVFEKTDRKLIRKGIKKIIFSPHRALHVLPLHLMKRSREGKDRYLFEDYEISYTPSTYVLHESLKNISHNQSEANENQLTLIGIVNPTNDLKWSEEEVNAVVELFPKAHILYREEAQHGTVLELLSQGTYLHFACHGRFNVEDPDRSGLLLAQDTIQKPEVITVNENERENQTLISVYSKQNDQAPHNQDRSISFLVKNKGPQGRLLTLSEIFYDLSFSFTRLVVLSACESGLVESLGKADEFIGLPAGFLRSGARAIISSLWLVQDESTKELMVRFYTKHLRDPLPPGAALRQAQLSMLNDNYSPYHWGAFILTGI